MSQPLQSVLLTAHEIEALRDHLSRGADGLESVVQALEHPVPNLAAYQSDIREIVSRARDGSGYITEDFGGFLEELDTLAPAYKAALAARG